MFSGIKRSSKYYYFTLFTMAIFKFENIESTDQLIPLGNYFSHEIDYISQYTVVLKFTPQ